MKKFNKLIAGVLVGTMVFSMSAMAVTESREITVSGSGSKETLPADMTNELDIVVPTSLSWNFVADPDGLASAEQGVAISVEDMKANGGKLVFGSNVMAQVINYSYRPITVDVTAVPTGSGAGDFVANEAALATANTAKQNKILFQIAASTAEINEDNDDAAFAGTVARNVSGTGAKLEFLLPGNEFEYTPGATRADDTFEIADDQLGHGTNIMPSGITTIDSDWTSYTSDLALDIKIVAKVVKADSTIDPTTYVNAAAYNLKANTTADTTIAASLAGPKVTTAYGATHNIFSLTAAAGMTLPSTGYTVDVTSTAGGAKTTITAATFAVDTSTNTVKVTLPDVWRTVGWAEADVKFGTTTISLVKSGAATGTGAMAVKVK